MKKIFLAVLATVLFISATSVDAMTKDELKNKLTASYTVNGSSIQVSSSQATLIERYLQQNDISSSDADYIAKKVDEALAVMEAGNARSLNELTKSEKNRIIAIIGDVSNKTAVKIKISKGNVLTIYNTDGTVFTVISDLIKYTDNSSMVVLAGAISLAGMLLLVRTVAKTRA